MIFKMSTLTDFSSFFPLISAWDLMISSCFAYTLGKNEEKSDPLAILKIILRSFRRASSQQNEYAKSTCRQHFDNFGVYSPNFRTLKLIRFFIFTLALEGHFAQKTFWNRKIDVKVVLKNVRLWCSRISNFGIIKRHFCRNNVFDRGQDGDKGPTSRQHPPNRSPV